ncbi:MAG: hypothetical protein GY845_03135 [Planctomycetes bacterium]|nr:hypothetical protein [Planctomycetota bacterium]
MPNEDYQNIQTTNAAVRIETDLYKRVTKHFHQGQLTALFRNIFESIDIMIQEDKFKEVSDYICKADSLTLKPMKD